MDIMVARMIDYSNSIAFSKTKLKLLNSCLAKIGKGRLFFVWHYFPKNFDNTMGYKFNFITMLLNINSLFWDCMPWFLCKKPNTIRKNLGDIIKEITKIDYCDLNKNITLINQLRNRICHNTGKNDFEFLQEIFANIDNSLCINDWLSFNFPDTIWEKCFDYFLNPIDEYFDNILNFFNSTKPSTLKYNDSEWDIILYTCYKQDLDFQNNIKLIILSDLYDIKKADKKFSVKSQKSKQIELWKRNVDSEKIKNQILKCNITNLPRNDLRPEKYFLSIINSLI